MKEWIDANDGGASVIPFSGILENKLVSMSPEDRQTFLNENKTQRYGKVFILLSLYVIYMNFDQIYENSIV